MSRRKRFEGDIDSSLSARDKSDAGPPFREALFDLRTAGETALGSTGGRKRRNQDSWNIY